MSDERTAEEIAEQEAIEAAEREGQQLEISENDDGFLGEAMGPPIEELPVERTQEEIDAEAEATAQAEAEAMESASREQGESESDWDYLQRSRHFKEPDDLARSYRNMEKHQTTTDQERARYRKELESAGYTFDETGEMIAPQAVEEQPFDRRTPEEIEEAEANARAAFDEQFAESPDGVIQAIAKRVIEEQLAPFKQKQYVEDMSSLVDNVIGAMEIATPGMGERINQCGEAVVAALASMPQAWKATDPERAIKIAIREALENSETEAEKKKSVEDSPEVKAAKAAAGGGGNGTPSNFKRTPDASDDDEEIRMALLEKDGDEEFFS